MKMIVIDPAGDLQLRLYKKGGESGFEAAGPSKEIIQGKIFVIMKVKKSVLVENSITFKMMLTGGFKEADQTAVDLESQYLTGLEVWLRFLHGTMNEEYEKVKAVDLFDVIDASNYYFFSLEKLNQ
jgi:hypothetical protein